MLHPPGLFDRDRSWSRNWPNVIWKLDTFALLWRSCCNTVKTASETSCGVGIFLWLAIVGQPIGVPKLRRSAYFAPIYINKAKSNTKLNQNMEWGRVPKLDSMFEHVYSKVTSTTKAIYIRMLSELIWKNSFQHDKKERLTASVKPVKKRELPRWVREWKIREKLLINITSTHNHFAEQS